MQIYRRNLIPGATYFFTVNLQDRSSRLLVQEIALLRHAFAAIRTHRPFRIDACVILPDHLHCIWTLPPDDADYPTRWRLIKSAFSRPLPAHQTLTASQAGKAERGIWQRRYWEHTLRNEQDYAAHLDYIHFNPVKHGYVSHPADWPHSSYHRCAARGLYPKQWIAAPDIPEAGERV